MSWGWWVVVGVGLVFLGCVVFFLIEVVRAPLVDSYGCYVDEKLTDDEISELLSRRGDGS